MRMKMKAQQLHVAMALMVAVGMVTSAADLTTTERPRTTTTEWLKTTTTEWPKTTTTKWPRTTGSAGCNLKGKMFTLSRDGGGVTLYPPSFSPPPSPPADATNPTIAPTTTPSITSSSPSPAWTTASPSRGVSVCLRYFAELSDYQRVFALSPSSRSHLELSGGRSYVLAFGGSYSPQNWFQSQRNRLSFSSFKPLWSRITPDFWTRVCVTVDTRRGVAQVFKNGFISIRKRLPWEYVWTGAPVIDISGFDGQVTDVQVWDFPLPYTEIFSYMNNGDFSPYRGNVITWSQVSYSARNNALLEDRYDWQLKRPIGGGDGRHGPMGEKMKFQNVHGKKERKRERMLM